MPDVFFVTDKLLFFALLIGPNNFGLLLSEYRLRQILLCNIFNVQITINDTPGFRVLRTIPENGSLRITKLYADSVPVPFALAFEEAGGRGSGRYVVLRGQRRHRGQQRKLHLSAVL